MDLRLDERSHHVERLVEGGFVIKVGTLPLGFQSFQSENGWVGLVADRLCTWCVAAVPEASFVTYLLVVINGGILYHPPPLWLRVQERPVPAEANLPYGERPIALRPSTCDE